MMTNADREQLQQTHDAVIRIETRIEKYNPEVCAQRGVKLQNVITALAVLWVVVIGILIMHGVIPDVNDPKPPQTETKK